MVVKIRGLLPQATYGIIAVALAAIGVLLFSGQGSATRADTPTPTPIYVEPESASTAPTPTAVPPFTSRITVMYTFRGIPIIILTGHLRVAYVNGDTKCNVLVTDRVYEALTDGTLWPWDRSSNPLCRQPGVSVRVCTGLTNCSAEFTYTGADVSGVDLPVTGLPADTPLAIAHFVHEGVSQTVTITEWLFESGGYVCSSGGGRPPALVSQVAHIWPTVSQCSPPGQDVNVTFTTVEFGDLHATFQWTSGDVNYDVDTGAFLPTPTPSPSPPPSPTASPTSSAPSPAASPTPALLPEAGGPPAGGSTPALIFIIAGAALRVASTAVAFSQRPGHNKT